MHLKIVGFKSHLDSQYDFDPNTTILLKGKSGSGKSTILQAIYWCLYGSMRGIYNNAGLSKRCSVTLKIKNLIIYRQKKPELLRITLVSDNKEKTYEDEVGQQIINQTFGSKNLWKSCSYIGQKERCLLLSGTNSERLELLNQLSFENDKPKEYIDRIGEELKSVNKEYERMNTKYNLEVENFTKQLQTRPVTLKLSSEEISLLESTLIELNQTKSHLYERVLIHQKNSGIHQSISQQITYLESELKSLTIITINADLINKIKSELFQLNQILYDSSSYVLLKEKKDNLVFQIQETREKLILLEDNLKNFPKQEFIDTTPEQIWKVRNQEMQYNQNLTLAQSLNISYNQEQINNLKFKLEQELIKQNQLKQEKLLYNQVKDILEDSSLEQKLNQAENKYNALILKIQSLKQGLDLLKCPSCAASLRYINQELVKEVGEPVTKSELNTQIQLSTVLENEINQLKLNLKNQERRTFILSQLTHSVSEIEQFRDNTSEINHKLSLLNKINLIDLPTMSSEELEKNLVIKQSQIQRQSLESEIKSLKSELNKLNQENDSIILTEKKMDPVEIKSKILSLESELQKLNQEENIYKQNLSKKDHILKQISVNRNKLSQILLYPSSSTDYEELLIKIKTHEHKLIEGKYGSKMILLQQELNQQRNNLIDFNNKLTNLQRLKQNAIQTECEQLENTVNQINNTLEDILPSFFQDPIKMILRLYRKTNKNLKPGLNISINYKEVEYDNLNQLSGGEGDRISLALLLAVNSVSNSPLIMLDECISSLNGSDKELCLETIRKIQNKTILCVEHEGVEGFYDRTLDININ